MSEALIKFLKPVISSEKSGASPPLSSLAIPNQGAQPESEGFQKFKPPPPELKLVKTDSQPDAPIDPNQGTAQSFIQLILSIQNQQGTLLQWLGNRAYSLNKRSHSKAGSFKKGTIIDKKNEDDD